jgi:hypothetical protein
VQEAQRPSFVPRRVSLSDRSLHPEDEALHASEREADISVTTDREWELKQRVAALKNRKETNE